MLILIQINTAEHKKRSSSNLTDLKYLNDIKYEHTFLRNTFIRLNIKYNISVVHQAW